MYSLNDSWNERGCFFVSSRRRHTRWPRDWSSDVCSSDLGGEDFNAEERGLGDNAACWPRRDDSEIGYAKTSSRNLDPLLRHHENTPFGLATAEKALNE